MSKIVKNDLDECVKNYLKSLSKYKSLTKREERVYLEDYKFNNNIEARNTVIQCNLKYACSIANEHRGRGVEFSDLIAEANDGLMEAIEKFDINQDIKFITYARWWIIQKVTSRIANMYKHNAYDIPYEKDKQEDNDDEQPLTNNNDYDSLIVDDIDKEQNSCDKKYYLHSLLNLLNERERDIITRYYGIDGDKENLYEISENYNLSSERIRQIMEGAFKKIRSYAMVS
jgi:RNA polymerase primary sigma factor